MYRVPRSSNNNIYLPFWLRRAEVPPFGKFPCHRQWVPVRRVEFSAVSSHLGGIWCLLDNKFPKSAGTGRSCPKLDRISHNSRVILRSSWRILHSPGSRAHSDNMGDPDLSRLTAPVSSPYLFGFSAGPSLSSSLLRTSVCLSCCCGSFKMTSSSRGGRSDISTPRFLAP